MSDTQTPINNTKQFLDKDGLNALWDKICSVFASKQELEDLGNNEVSIITMQMINDVWEDIIDRDDAVLDAVDVESAVFTYEETEDVIEDDLK